MANTILEARLSPKEILRSPLANNVVNTCFENSVLIGSSQISTTSDYILIWPKKFSCSLTVGKFELRKSENFSG